MHILFLSHGLWGNETHLEYLVERVQLHHPDIIIANFHTSAGLKTYDGIDVIGDRFVDFVFDTLNSYSSNELKEPKITKISFVGYSLGGLVIRYAIGKLNSMNIFDSLTPKNFITFATPHLGTVRKNVSLLNRIMNYGINKLTLATGKQLNLRDDYINGVPLLVIMADPKFCFAKGLAKFKNRAVFSNVKNDFSVRYTTASFNPSNPYRKYQRIQKYPDFYPSIVTYNEVHPPQKEQWTRREIAIVALIITLSPILIPVISVVLFGVLPISSLYKHLKDGTIFSNKQWFSKHHSDEPAEVVEKELMRKTMIDNLNLLSFTKIDVYVPLANAHAAIINRRRMFERYADVVQYFVDKVFEY